MPSTINSQPSTPPDFTDWLSPMLVKEFRQGLRSRVFVVGFILIQVVMVGLVLLKLLAMDEANAGWSNKTTSFMWLTNAAVLLALQPHRAGQALREEIVGNTLELALVSNLRASGIVWGKWLALIAQSALFITAVLPYFLLRYFFGGMEVTAELIGLAIMLMASCLLMAMTLFLSTVSLGVRVFLVIVGMPFMLAMLGCMGGGIRSGIAGFIAVTFIGGIFTLVCLELAASNVVSISGRVMRLPI